MHFNNNYLLEKKKKFEVILKKLWQKTVKYLKINMITINYINCESSKKLKVKKKKTTKITNIHINL